MLLLSPAVPIRPPSPASTARACTPAQYPRHGIASRRLCTDDKPRHVTVVGGGFIGLEMMEALHQRKLEVTLLELSDQVMAPVDKEMANMLHARIQEEGIDLRLHRSLPSSVWMCRQRKAQRCLPACA